MHPARPGSCLHPLIAASSHPTIRCAQAAALDYVKAPSGKFAMPEAKKGGKKGDEHKLTKKLKVGLPYCVEFVFKGAAHS